MSGAAAWIGDSAAWDALAERAPGGDYRQSAGWAALKSLLGRRAIRFALTQESDLVGGAQVLLRRIGPIGVGHVDRWPSTELRAMGSST
jgi:hypothetical protein